MPPFVASIGLNVGIDVSEPKVLESFGSALGLGEGDLVELVEGVPVGWALGLDDGSFVGLDEGDLEGLIVGYDIRKSGYDAGECFGKR